MFTKEKIDTIVMALEWCVKQHVSCRLVTQAEALELIKQLLAERRAAGNDA